MNRRYGRATLPLVGAALAVSLGGCPGPSPEEADAFVNLPDATVTDAGPRPEADLAFTPLLGSFGDVVIGSSSAAQEFTVRNSGTGPSTALNVSLSGASATSFSIGANSCAGARLDAGDTCTFSITFRPSAEGSASASVTVTDGSHTVIGTLEGNGLTDAGLSISPTPYNFGSVTLGAAGATHTFTVQNTGDSPSGELLTSITGLDATQFVIGADDCAGETLAAGASCTVEVRYAPSAAGTHSGSLSVTSSPGGTVTAALQGAAVAPASLRLTPTSQSFGSVVTGSSSADVTFTLRNAGGIATGTISQSLTGANASEFRVVTSTCAGAPLDGGDTCTVVVRFSPSSAGTKAASLELTDGTLTASAALDGEGLAPGNITIDPTTRDFGTSAVGTAIGATTFTIRNSGSTPTGVLTAAVAGANPADFPFVGSGDGCSGSTLAAGATCTVAVQFQPSAAGPRGATLRVQGTPGGSVTAALSGTGEAAAAIRVAPTSVDFGSVATGRSSSDRSFTISNAGTASTSVPTVELRGVQATQFSIVSNGCTSALAGGTDCTVTVRFSPTSLGLKTATLNVSATTGGSGSADISGTGITPAALSINPTTSSFGNVVETESATRTFTLSNSGADTTGTLTAGISGAAASDFTIVANTCTTLTSSASCQIDVRFAPSTQGLRAATLTVSGSPGGTVTAALDGTGTPDIEITPATGDSFDFGDVRVGDSASMDYRITNRTSRELTSFAITSPSAAPTTSEFVRANRPLFTACGASLAAGASCWVRVTFSPTGSAGPRSVALSATGSGGSSETQTLMGNAVGAVRFTQWQIGTGPSSTTFPAAFGNRTIGGYTDVVLTVRNDNSTPSPRISTSASFSGDMSIQADGCTGRTLTGSGPGRTCTITVRFYPRTAAAASGTVTISYGSNSASAEITGTGIPGASLVVTGSGDFGTVLGRTSQTRTFTVTNPGAVPTSSNLAFSLPGAPTGYTIVTGTGGGTCVTSAPLAAGASCTIVVRFDALPAYNVLTGFSYDGTLAVSAGSPSANTALTARVGAHLAVTPATGSFATGAGTTSAAQTFTVRNNGSTATAAIAVSLGGADPATFTSSHACTTLPAGGTCTVTVDYRPSSSSGGSNHAATLAVSEGGIGSGQAGYASAALTGQSRRPANLEATLPYTTSGSPFDFGSVLVGSNSGLASFTFRNPGDFATGTLSLTVPAHFAVGTNGCSGTLAAGASCTVTLRFSPSASGSQSGSLTLRQGTVLSASHPVIGTGLSSAQALSISPSPYYFGESPVGTARPAQTFTVTNTSASAVALGTAPSCAGGACGSFTISAGTCTGSLAAGANCTFSATFNPDATGLRQGSLGWSGSGTVPVSGIGLTAAALALSTGIHAFGDQVVGTTSTPFVFTITNTGGVPTTATPTAALGGADPGQFAIGASTCSGALAGGASCTFEVTFRPTAAGNRAATFTVTAGSLSQTATLSGRGLAAALLGISPSAPQTCADHYAGGSFACTSYTVSNNGGSDATNLSLALTGDFAFGSSTCTVGGSLAPSGTCTVAVLHTPQTVGADSGTLTVGATGIASVTGTISSAGISALTSSAAPTGWTAPIDGSSFQTITITNQSASTVATGVLTAAISGTNAADFDIEANTCLGVSLAAGGTCSITVRFVPPALGARTATLTVTDGTAEKQVSIALSATGVAAPG